MCLLELRYTCLCQLPFSSPKALTEKSKKLLLGSSFLFSKWMQHFPSTECRETQEMNYAEYIVNFFIREAPPRNNTHQSEKKRNYNIAKLELLARVGKTGLNFPNYW